MDEEEDEPLADDSPFVLCPSTFEPNKLGHFRIIILTEHPLAQLPTEIPKLTELRREGRWLSHNAGGCRNYVTWRKNEQYLLRLTKAARASVRARRETRRRAHPATHPMPHIPLLPPSTYGR